MRLQRTTVLLLLLVVGASVYTYAQDSEEEEFGDAPWDEEDESEEEAPKEDEPDHSREFDEGSDDGTEAAAPTGTAIMDWIGAGKYDDIIKKAEEGGNLDWINKPNEWGETAMHHASMPHNAQTKMLAALIKAGATIDKQDVDGCTALIWAVHNNHPENAMLLLKGGASTTVKDQKGRTPMDHAMSAKMKQLFLKDGEVADSGVPDLDVEKFDQEVINSDVDVVLYMYSPSCGHCREFAPMYDELAAALRPTSIKFMKIDVTKGNPPEPYGVNSLPTILLSKKKTESGVKPQPREFGGRRTVKGITEWLQQHVTNRFMYTSGGKEQAVPENSIDAQASDAQEAAPGAGDALQADDPTAHEEL